jgi:hypothetical protein
MTRSRARRLLAGIWAANLFAALLFGGIFFFRRFSSETESPLPLASPTPFSVSSPTPNPALPTAYFLPTYTPNPHATEIVVVTPTPFALDALAQRPLVIGYSVLGRPLEVYRFGAGERERFILAGIHGGYEWNTVALAEELIRYLSENPEVIPPDMTLYILRDMNPDGEARSHSYDGRVNEHGVDLNRNFPYHWKESWNLDGCWQYRPVTAGAYPASEPETVAVINFIHLHHIEAIISYHSAALGVFAGGDPPFEPSERLAETISLRSGYQYPPIDTGCEMTGDLTDWASSLEGIPAVDIELLNHRDTDFERNLRVLDAFLHWER